MHITCVFEYMRYTGCTYKLYIFIYSISSLCVSREMVYLQILSLHLPMDYVFWYCFLFMRFSDLKNKQALFEKDERLIFKRFEKICLLSKQISMKTSLWDFSSLRKNQNRNGMELLNLFQQCQHLSHCVCCSFGSVLTCSLCFGSGEGGWEFFHFLMDVVSFYPPCCTPNPFFSPPSVDAVASVDGFR